MGILDIIFKKKSRKKHLIQEEIEENNIEFKEKHEKAQRVFQAALEYYNENSCQCAFPRFQQIIGIDCRKSRDSFKCFDTDLLISISDKYFDISTSDRNDENSNEKWTCKKCGSIYEYGWSDFSIHVERQKLELTDLKAEEIGESTVKPIPLYLGLMGHSYPSKSIMGPSGFGEFEKYILEK